MEEGENYDSEDHDDDDEYDDDDNDDEESERNPNKNLMMRRAGLSRPRLKVIGFVREKI